LAFRRAKIRSRRGYDAEQPPIEGPWRNPELGKDELVTTAAERLPPQREIDQIAFGDVRQWPALGWVGPVGIAKQLLRGKAGLESTSDGAKEARRIGAIDSAVVVAEG
jgi:hypothetical protein